MPYRLTFETMSTSNSLSASSFKSAVVAETGVPTLIMASAATATFAAFFKSLSAIQPRIFQLRSAAYLTPTLYNQRFHGIAVNVGDADGVRIWHVPTWRRFFLGKTYPPSNTSALKGKTISIRLAGIDSPEGAHFGMTEQPYHADALLKLRSLVLNKPVSFVPHSIDRYGRVVASVYTLSTIGKMTPFWFPMPANIRWKSVGRELVTDGLAVIYRQAGAQYGGDLKVLESLEKSAKKKKIGIWSGGKNTVLPSEHKRLYRSTDSFENNIIKPENNSRFFVFNRLNNEDLVRKRSLIRRILVSVLNFITSTLLSITKSITIRTTIRYITKVIIKAIISKSFLKMVFRFARNRFR